MTSRTLAAAAALGAAATPAAAQQPAPAGAAPPGCTYETCALRRERVWFSERILAGRDGRVVARPRAFGVFALDSLIGGTPEALPHLRRYRTEQTRGQLLSLVGGALGAVAVVTAIDRGGDDRAWRGGQTGAASPSTHSARGAARSPTGRSTGRCGSTTARSPVRRAD